MKCAWDAMLPNTYRQKVESNVVLAEGFFIL